VGTTLIVANQTIGGTELTAAVAERIAGGSVEFNLLVPMPPTPASAIAAGLAAVESAASILVDLPDPKVLAEERLAAGLAWLEGLGASATGEIGPTDAVAAVTVIVERGGIDEIIVSTLPSRLSRWLKQDLPTRLGKAVDVPITVVTARHE
jgi:hypothetical protein